MVIDRGVFIAKPWYWFFNYRLYGFYCALLIQGNIRNIPDPKSE